MQTFRNGFLGGLAAIALVAMIFVGVMTMQAKNESATQRTTLLRQIDEYEAWQKDPTVSFWHARQRTDPSRYPAMLNNFTVQRHPFQEYFAWWQDDFYDRNPHTGYNNFVRTEAPAELLRDDAAIDRFFTKR
jgi:hypothetical protein